MSNENMNFNDDLVQRIENAAREGAREGAKHGKRRGISLGTILLLIILAGALFLGYQAYNMKNSLAGLIEREAPVEDHDLTLENHGFLGYTVADFQDAILGDSKQMKKIEVYSQKVSDLAELTQTGLGKLKVFTKCQYITYHGTAVYTVDLSKLNKDSITLDEEKQVVTLRIPHAQQEKINIPSDEITFGDVKKGILALGKMNVTPEEMSKVQTEAEKKMEEQLKNSHVIDEADRFAKMSVWEIYQPMVNKVTTGYSLEVLFEDE